MAEQLSRSEAALIRRRIAAALCNLVDCRIYWCPGARKVAARSMQLQRRPWPLPPDALELGRYAHGLSSTADVLEDLQDLIAS